MKHGSVPRSIVRAFDGGPIAPSHVPHALDEGSADCLIDEETAEANAAMLHDQPVDPWIEIDAGSEVWVLPLWDALMTTTAPARRMAKPRNSVRPMDAKAA